MQARLTRSHTDRMIGGVCGGLGYYFSVDPVIVRLIFVVLALTTGITLIVYPILWLVMPEAGAVPPHPSALPPDARFDPLSGQPLPPRQPVVDQMFSAQERSAPQPAAPASGRNRTLGLLLLGIGVIVLMNNMGEALSRIFGFGIDISGFVVPVLLVGLGMYLLRKKTV
ncbi:MAG TPA: PspC domain-containing protein [Herpetosiphonaceae bacterium]